MNPKVATMGFFGDEDESNSSTGSPSANSVVVKCPECLTQFSVYSTVIAKAVGTNSGSLSNSSANFHCSRCDAVFAVEPSTFELHAKEKTQQNDSLAESSMKQTKPAQHEAQHRTISKSDFSVSGVKNESTTADTFTPDSFMPTETTPQKANLVFNPPETFKPQNITELPKVNPGTPPQLEIFQKAKELQSDMSNRTAAAISSLRSAPFSLFDDPPKSSTVNEQQPAQTVKVERMIPSHIPPEREHSARIKLPGMVGESLAFTRMQSLGLLTVPLLFTLSVLVFASYAMRVSPLSFGALFASILPSLGVTSPELPSNELHLTKTSLKFVKLTSKEVVPVISGTLVNTGDVAVDGVVVEGLGFDTRAALALNSRAPLRSALGREKVSELNMETIQKYQVALGAKRNSIGAKEEVPFSVALLEHRMGDDRTPLGDVDLTDIKYFSARVFAVNSKVSK